MTNLIVAFPKMEEARSLKSLLVRNGFHVIGVCTSGTQAISQADELGGGIIISSYKLTDMLYSQLHELLPGSFDMLLLASERYLDECRGSDIICVGMPLKVQDLINTVSMMVENHEHRKRRQKSKPKERNEREYSLICEAKTLLMERNKMTEEEAHRYIQKCSMNNCTSMVETSQMILAMMKTE